MPTVAYHGTGGLEDSIVDGTTGVLVEDFDAMVDAVDTLLTERETREQLGEAARAYAAQFSWSTTVQEWDDELSRVIAADGTQDP